MEKVLICLITTAGIVGVVALAIAFCIWWLKNCYERYIESEAIRLSHKNIGLNQKLRAKKREIKQLQKLVEERDIEIEQLEQNVQDIEQINSDLAEQIIELENE